MLYTVYFFTQFKNTSSQYSLKINQLDKTNNKPNQTIYSVIKKILTHYFKSDPLPLKQKQKWRHK